MLPKILSVGRCQQIMWSQIEANSYVIWVRLMERLRMHQVPRRRHVCAHYGMNTMMPKTGGYTCSNRVAATGDCAFVTAPLDVVSNTIHKKMPDQNERQRPGRGSYAYIKRIP